jgi:hypothetical protein
MKRAAAAGKPRQQQAASNHLRKQGPSHRNSHNHQVSTFNFPDLPNGLVVFQKNGIIGEWRPQSQAALQWDLAIGLDQKFLYAEWNRQG